MKDGEGMATVTEKTKFSEDSETDPDGKNTRLASLLGAGWIDLDVVMIERIEIGSKKGWRVTFRE